MADQYLDSATIKLLIDRKRECVVVGEAGKDYVDMLNSVATFPMATVVRLARTQEGFEGYGSFSNLHRSVEGLSLECFNTPACKEMLLHPRFVGEELCRKRKVKVDDAAMTKYFTCPDCSKTESSVLQVWLSYYKNARCDCGRFMNKELYVKQEEFTVNETGNKGRYEALISDKLLYMLNHATHLLKWFKDHGIKCMSQVEEKTVTVCLEQISCLLLNTAISKTALTDNFLKKQGGVKSEGMNQQPLISSTKEITRKARPLTVDVVVRKSDGKILYAVADKEFIDLLFTFLTLPLETVWHMIGFPYWLVLQDYELPPYYHCHRLLPKFKAQVPPKFVSSSMLSPLRKYSQGYEIRGGEKRMGLIDPKSPNTLYMDFGLGYAKDNAMFLVSDDLVVQNLALASTISLVKELGIPISDLEIQKISIGEKEALELLEASFRTSSVLNIALGSLLQVMKEEV